MPRTVGLTDESRENYLISLALDAAERDLQSDKPSPLVIAHFLRAGSQRAQLEREKIRQETELMAAKKTALEAEESQSEMYQQAIEAMKMYSRTSDYYD